MQLTIAWALGGINAAHTQWRAWRRGGVACLRSLGLPVPFVAWWGRWRPQAITAYYGDAPKSFVVIEEVELPWPPGERGASWGLVSLQDTSPAECVAKCVPEQEEWIRDGVNPATPPPWGWEPPRPPGAFLYAGGLRSVCKGSRFGLHPPPRRCAAGGGRGGALSRIGGCVGGSSQGEGGPVEGVCVRH